MNRKHLSGWICLTLLASSAALASPEAEARLTPRDNFLELQARRSEIDFQLTHLRTETPGMGVAIGMGILGTGLAAAFLQELLTVSLAPYTGLACAAGDAKFCNVPHDNSPLILLGIGAVVAIAFPVAWGVSHWTTEHRRQALQAERAQIDLQLDRLRVTW